LTPLPGGAIPAALNGGGDSMPVPDSALCHRYNTSEPDIIDQDMTTDDIVFVLEHLNFATRHNDGRALGSLKLDRPIRDHLVACLQRKAAGHR
jgi:hypothetical protein